MSIDRICAEVSRIRKVTDETDPFRICDELEIVLMRKSLGTARGAIKGFFFYVCRTKAIAINSDMSDVMQRIVAAHELGHAQLHAKGGDQLVFHDSGFLKGGTVAEDEANLFASDLLISDEDVLETFACELPFFKAAAELCVPPELLEFKLRILKYKGYDIKECPIHARANFFKDLN